MNFVKDSSEATDMGRSFWNEESHLMGGIRTWIEHVSDSGPIYDPSDQESKKMWGWMESDDSTPLPDGFEWSELRLSAKLNIESETEGGDVIVTPDLIELHALLRNNYITDGELFSYNLSPTALKWSLCGPNYFSDWHCGLREVSSGKLVAFIASTPCTLRAHMSSFHAGIVNFLCIKKDLRNLGLAPRLITEITRRHGKRGVYQAIYTESKDISLPVSVAQPWHRPLNTKKLIEVAWLHMTPRDTMQRLIRKYFLPIKPKLSLERISREDLPSAHNLLNKKLDQCQLARTFSSEEFEHNFMTVNGVCDTWVMRDEIGGNGVTDMISIYYVDLFLTNQHREHSQLKMAFGHYHATSTVTLKDLTIDAMVLAREAGADVYTLLDVMGMDADFMQAVGAEEGDCPLNYHLYNWLCPSIDSEQVGVVLI